MKTFEQILDMDDDDDNRDFSKGIVYDFFAQADQTFDQMDDALYVYPLLLSIGPLSTRPCIICAIGAPRRSKTC